ncbi:Xaa-Pro dipeptidase [Sporanaerobium hydrogeniformans]|uniref:Xaa-Pro dipeptidase n=1 Tax=Sporanaerobium hydrogeniformans TaxID=3072179 RepID=A0AC61DIK4_9FIRM|nr:Xaa-Pro peptidase family protein [Sporanaerobium hydrogeniformans]PHV72351.1 Xaa-Pro dipeptidase [Sporanaerobium hydrogeniformans]
MKTRIQKLLCKMEELKIEAMLIDSRTNRRYMSGFSGSSAMLYITSKRQILITDFRYLEQAAKECPDYEIISQGNLGLLKTALKYASEEGIKVLGFESEHVSYATYLTFAEQKSFTFIPTQKVIEDFRKIKDNEEIKKIAKAESIGDLAFSHIIEFLKEGYHQGITENDVALEIERVMRKNGATGTSFDSIVATGVKSSLPHAQPSNCTFKKGDFVVMDFGCIYEGYCSDMTRTVVIGEANQKQVAIYNTVLEAQHKALEVIQPGMKGKEVDQIARDIIAKAGYDTYFGHGLGHSLGLDIHENPRFSPLEEATIEVGMCMTVEPGIYIPDFGGVRIEDVVVVTETGILNLTHSPKELIVIK